MVENELSKNASKLYEPIDEYDIISERKNLIDFGYRFAHLETKLRLGLIGFDEEQRTMDKEELREILNDLFESAVSISYLKQEVAMEIRTQIFIIDRDYKDKDKIDADRLRNIYDHLGYWYRVASKICDDISKEYFPLLFIGEIAEQGDIYSNLLEALIAFHNGAYRATVVMCRRSLQLIAMQLGAPNDTLKNQLEWLKTNKRIDEEDYLTATACRKFGNFGAHPSNDGLEKIDKFNAEMTLKTVNHLFVKIYQPVAAIKFQQKSKELMEAKQNSQKK